MTPLLIFAAGAGYGLTLGAALTWREAHRRLGRLAAVIAPRPVEVTLADLPVIRDALFRAVDLLTAVEEEQVLVSDEIRERAADFDRTLAAFGGGG